MLRRSIDRKQAAVVSRQFFPAILCRLIASSHLSPVNHRTLAQFFVSFVRSQGFWQRCQESRALRNIVTDLKGQSGEFVEWRSKIDSSFDLIRPTLADLS